ncbi:hypothetical protein MOQ_004120 [Trypanosoma cruzi marinkellei]|uniref:Uncharacterized protein n=1 Tax=Trypanosoma cruzi marinkellei TaxID=85056 RepID=K2MY94_TRYCR|nr:hypothetical protein MOQ_004120 [Trypanosoma cruzi marinkellei]
MEKCTSPALSPSSLSRTHTLSLYVFPFATPSIYIPAHQSKPTQRGGWGKKRKHTQLQEEKSRKRKKYKIKPPHSYSQTPPPLHQPLPFFSLLCLLHACASTQAFYCKWVLCHYCTCKYSPVPPTPEFSFCFSSVPHVFRCSSFPSRPPLFPLLLPRVCVYGNYRMMQHASFIGMQGCFLCLSPPQEGRFSLIPPLSTSAAAKREREGVCALAILAADGVLLYLVPADLLLQCVQTKNKTLCGRRATGDPKIYRNGPFAPT